MKTAYKLLSVTKSHIARMIRLPMEEVINTEEIICPENPVEKAVLGDSEFQKGLMWGQPRYGHPEGKIVYHIREVLDNVDQLETDSITRRKLRLITILHDTFKYAEHKGWPRDWSRHHGVLARKFAEAFTRESDVLDVTEVHDEAYYAWRMIHLYGKEEAGNIRLQKLLDRLGEDNLQLYYLFFKCDTQTGDKIQAPLKWFEETIQGIEVVV